MSESYATRCGYVAIIGRPNVGKSTLLNQILGSKMSITAGKPQTTRHQILGVKTQADLQAIYVDTPGIHSDNQTELNKQMNKAAWSVCHDVDLIVFVVDRTKWTAQEDIIAERLKQGDVPVIVAVNKIDHLDDKSALLPALQTIADKVPAEAYYPISAKTGDGVKAMEQAINEHLPEGPHLFGPEDKTNRQLRFQLAETVREKLIRFLGDELPHATTVEIERIQKKPNVTEVHALIWVERDSQKKIIIGSGGQTLKRIATQARHDCEKLLDDKVMLRTWVKVKKGWRDDTNFLTDAGYMDD